MDTLYEDIGKRLIDLVHKVKAHETDIALALGTLLLGYVFFKLTSALFRKALLRSKVQDAFARLLIDNVYKALIFIVVVITAAGQLGFNLTAPLAGLGIAGIAIGLAAQDSLSNIIAGFLIFFDKPFKVRDYVTLGEHYGRVEQITMRSTRIRTPDNTYVVIPNKKIIDEVLVDHSTNGEIRLVIPVEIEYGASIQNAREAILAEFGKIDGILKKPEADVVVESLADSGVLLHARFWITNASEERGFHFAGGEAVKTALDAAGIAIAYPHMKVVK